jgi:hypothetical protein
MTIRYRYTNRVALRGARRLALGGWLCAVLLLPALAQALAPCPTCPSTGTSDSGTRPTPPGPNVGCETNASAAIESRRVQTPAWSCSATLSDLVINGVSGKYRDCSQGRIVWSAGTCAHRVPSGPIYQRYFTGAENAAVRSAVGFPVEGPIAAGPAGSQRFSSGVLASNAAGTAAIVGGTAVPPTERNALITKWRQAIPGKQPAHDTVWTGAGAYFTTDPDLGFDKTFTVAAGASTAYFVKGPIQDRYIAAGAFDGQLGWPTSDESCLDVPCRYAYSNFQRGHIRWTAGPDRAQVATVMRGVIPATPRRIVFDPDLGKDTFSFTLSRSLQALDREIDSDQDGLADDAEKQLAFLTAPRIFWDEEESSSENQHFVYYRRLDMVQVRPRSENVSRWTAAQGRKWVTIRFIMAYPEQYSDGPPKIASNHIGDSEMFEIRLFNVGGSFSEWRIAEFVFTPHGGGLQYYGDVGVLAGRAKALNTAHIWIAADEDAHGSWGGSDPDSQECKPGTFVTHHDCFDGTLREAFGMGRYWWFDPSRDIGEPEALRYDAWPLEPRGSTTHPFLGPAVAPQIKREPNNPYAAYIENNSGRGVAREYIRYTDKSPEIPAAKRWCGWRCPQRTADGQCAYYPDFGFPDDDDVNTCDGGGKKFPNRGFTTSLYGNLYPVGVGYYRSGALGPNAEYQRADFAYQLWGNPNILPLTSGNVANRWQYESIAGETTLNPDGSASPRPVLDAHFSVEAVIDGDRKGSGWGEGGVWRSKELASPSSPQIARVGFKAPRTIRRIDVFTVQDDLNAPAEPTPAMTFTKFGIRDFLVEYCAGPRDEDCATAQSWRPLATTTGNDKVWRTYTFAPVTAKAIRVRVTKAAEPPTAQRAERGTTVPGPVAQIPTMGPARITEIEAWE